MQYKIFKTSALLILMAFIACKKEKTDTPIVTPPVYKLIFKYHFDKNQVRLNNFGQPETVPAGHGAQSPDFNFMSSHYIELAQDSLTLLGYGSILYRAPETTAGGASAIDFSQSTVASEGQTFFSIPLSQVAAGTYKWLRVSLAYQNYNIHVKYLSYDLTGTVASFIGYNTYLTDYKPAHHTVTVNGNRLQGYWAFEIDTLGLDTVVSGQSSGTTVPNPLAFTSPVPAGSCVVTGQFPIPLSITGTETHDIVVQVSLSVNNSFEWKDTAGDNLYEPAQDTIVDMGIRGLIPIVQ